MIPLSEFEQHINPTILKRGMDYWKKGRVTELQYFDGSIEAIVEGESNYDVELYFKNEHLSDSQCTCPYHEAICKHVVAVLFKLQEDRFSELHSSGKEILKERNTKNKKNISTDAKKPFTKKPKSPLDKTQEILSAASKKELERFVLELAKENRLLRDRIFNELSPASSALVAQKTYSTQINNILKSAKDRYGFIDYRSANGAFNAIEKLMLSAKAKLSPSSAPNMINLCCAVIEEVTHAIQFSDDSDGGIGNNIHLAFEILHEMISSSWITNKEDLLSLFLKNAAGEVYEGWDWKWNFASLAANLSEKQKDFDTVMAFLQKQEEDGVSEHCLSSILEVKTILYKKFRNEEETHQLLYEYSADWTVFNRLLQAEFDRRNFQKVKQLATERLKHETKAGLSSMWGDWILKAAIAVNDLTEILLLAEKRFFSSSHEKMKNLDLLKEYTAADKWPQKQAQIISILEKEDRLNKYTNSANEFLPEFYLRENEEEKLLLWVKKYTSFNTLAKYDEHLKENFQNELAELYKQEISRFLEKNTGRDYYIVACRMIRRMKKMTGNMLADNLLSELKVRYKMRPALLQELEKI